MNIAVLTSAFRPLFWGVGYGGRGKELQSLVPKVLIHFTFSKWLCELQICCNAECESKEVGPIHHTHSHGPLTVEDLCSLVPVSSQLVCGPAKFFVC